MHSFNNVRKYKLSGHTLVKWPKIQNANTIQMDECFAWRSVLVFRNSIVNLFIFYFWISILHGKHINFILISPFWLNSTKFYFGRTKSEANKHVYILLNYSSRSFYTGSDLMNKYAHVTIDYVKQNIKYQNKAKRATELHTHRHTMMRYQCFISCPIGLNRWIGRFVCLYYLLLAHRSQS